MKFVYLTILTFGLLACNNYIVKKSLGNETSKNISVKIDNFLIEKHVNSTNNYDCDFDRFLNDPKIPKLAKDLIYETAKNPTDNEPLTYFEKFKSKDKQEREFYFKAVTNSFKIADGAYSEGLGYTGKEFIENNPKEFSSFFENKNCFTDNDFETWADILILEFAIDNEGAYYKPFIDLFIEKLKSNCKDCSKTEIETIHKFGLKLNAKWYNYMKQLNKQ
jgi:hypothetical protein